MAYAAAGCTGSSKAPTLRNGGLNEDRFQISKLQIRNDDCALYVGVFDGHGGPGASSYLVETYLGHLQDNLRKGRERPLEAVLHDSFLTSDRALWDVVNVLGKQFAHLKPDRCDCSFYRELPCRCLRAPRSAHEGSTGTVILFTNDRLYCANVGDSEALLVTKSGFVKSTMDNGCREYGEPGSRSALNLPPGQNLGLGEANAKTNTAQEACNEEKHHEGEQISNAKEAGNTLTQGNHAENVETPASTAATSKNAVPAPFAPTLSTAGRETRPSNRSSLVDVGPSTSALGTGSEERRAHEVTTPNGDDNSSSILRMSTGNRKDILSPPVALTDQGTNKTDANNITVSLSVASTPPPSPHTTGKLAALDTSITSSSGLAGTLHNCEPIALGLPVTETKLDSGAAALPNAVGDQRIPMVVVGEPGEAVTDSFTATSAGSGEGQVAPTLPLGGPVPLRTDINTAMEVSDAQTADQGFPSGAPVNSGSETDLGGRHTSEPGPVVDALIARKVDSGGGTGGYPRLNLHAETMTIADTPVPHPQNEDYLRVKNIARTRVRRKPPKTRSGRNDGIRRGPSSRYNYVALEGAHSLNMTRAFGNFGHKVFSEKDQTPVEEESPIIVRPHVNVFSPAFDNDFLFVVVASDGLWDNLDKFEVALVVREYCMKRIQEERAKHAIHGAAGVGAPATDGATGRARGDGSSSSNNNNNNSSSDNKDDFSDSGTSKGSSNNINTDGALKSCRTKKKASPQTRNRESPHSSHRQQNEDEEEDSERYGPGSSSSRGTEQQHTDETLLASMAEGASEELLAQAISRNRKQDDITVVVVLFHNILLAANES